MRYDNLIAFEKHLKSAYPLHLSPLYLIVSKEEFERKEALSKLLYFLVPKGEKKEDLLSSWNGVDLKLDQLVDELDSFSFFSKTRIILVEGIDSLAKPALEKLEGLIRTNSPLVFIVLAASSLSKLSQFYKNIEKVGIILDIPEKKPWEQEKKLVDWVNSELSKEGKTMPYGVIQQLLKQLGNDQFLIINELKKLICFVGERNEISRKDVEAICTSFSTDSIWQLGEAIFCRRGSEALLMIKGLLDEGHPFLPLLRQLRSQFVIKYQIAVLLDSGKAAADISTEFTYMKGQILEKNIQLTREYGLKSLHKGLLVLDEIEMRAKNSQIEDQLLAEILITKLIRKQ